MRMFKVESLKFRGLCLWALLLFSPLTFAQREASDVRKGNREYKNENFTEAEGCRPIRTVTKRIIT